MESIARELKDGERFIVLHQEDSFLRFLRDIVPDPTRVLRTEDNVDLEYISAHAFFIIERNFIFPVSNVHPRRDVEVTNGIGVQIIDPATAQEKILGAQLETVH
jgi:hypothetical protein